MVTTTKIDSSGNYFTGGELDDVSATYFQNKVITYTFNGNTTISFANTTITANTGASGGSYSVINDNGRTGGVIGGAGASGLLIGADVAQGGGGGAVGGGNGSGAGGGTFTDVSGFLAAYTDAGYTYNLSVFGKGGDGGFGTNGTPGGIPGAGGGGASYTFSTTSSTSGGAGANGAVLIQYKSRGIYYYNYINQSAGSGTITLPIGTTYVKFWAIAQGAPGGSYTFVNFNYYGGDGGRAGGIAYASFDVSDYGLSNTFWSSSSANTVRKQYSNGSLQTLGEIDEYTTLNNYRTLTYNFTSSIATAVFYGLTIKGNPGNLGASGVQGAGGTGGTGSITGTSSVLSNSGTATGGDGGNGVNLVGGGGGGGINGGAGGNGIGAGGTGNNIGTAPNDLFSAVATALGSSTNFGKGGVGGDRSFSGSQQPGSFAGGGGGGGGGTGSSNFNGAVGANAGIVIKYTVNGVTYAVVINQNGTITGGGGGIVTTATTVIFPALTTYVKIWCIGAGGQGGQGGGSEGGGGGAGGAGFADFSNFVISKQYSNGALQILGYFDEISVNLAQKLTYNLSTSPSVTYMSVTATGNIGTNGASPDINGLGGITGGAGGAGSVSGTSLILSSSGTVTGGQGGNGNNSVFLFGGAGGSLGGVTSGYGTNIATTGNIGSSPNDLFSALTLIYGSVGTFGKGGRGGDGASTFSPASGVFAGGGGGGYGPTGSSLTTNQSGAGASYAIVIQYLISGTYYAAIIQSGPTVTFGTNGNGGAISNTSTTSILFPTGTSYVKVWAIGGGGRGGEGGPSAGGGGGSGGVGWASFGTI